MQKNTTQSLNQVFAFSVMLFITLRLVDQVMLYRQVDLFGLSLTAGVFIMPLYYYVGDAIAELFGYQVAKRVVFYMLCCGVIFSILIMLLNLLPAPSNWKLSGEYNDVLGHLLRSNLAALVIVPVASLLNAKLLTKWKFMTKGKYFWLRSLGSSAAAEAVQNILGCLLLYTGIMPFSEVLYLMVSLYAVQIVCGIIIATPGLFIVNILKQKVGDFTISEVMANPFVKRDL